MPWLDSSPNAPDLAEAFILSEILDNRTLLEAHLACAGAVRDEQCQLTIAVATEAAAFGEVAGECIKDASFDMPVLFGLSQQTVKRTVGTTVQRMRGAVLSGHQHHLPWGRR